jgi:4-hydroxythreonine-4-phosphate dehydrogenase
MPGPGPVIAVTLGDPAGVGPEVIVGSWTETVVHDWCRPVVFGHPEILRRAVRLWQTKLDVVEVDSPREAEPSPGVIPCVPCVSDNALEVAPGTIDARAGQAAYDAVVKAVGMALDGQVDAVATAPLHKEAWNRAGHDYPGHTELLAELCNVSDYAMMLYLGPDEEIRGPAGLAVVHVTLHVALRDVCAAIDEDAVLAKARLADGFMTRLKGSRPRIGVCSLNPHRGEGGLFGDEERRVIRPAVERGLAEGLNIEGPLPTDTLMVQARDGHFDAVVAMYHDQGHIALKLLGMHRAVNITLGLPIVRTSVAHGTAFDIAWQRQCETGSMIEALHVASRLASSAGK